MDPSQDSSSSIASNVLTVVIHLLCKLFGMSLYTEIKYRPAASILSFCLARRSYFRISPKRIHPAIQIASSRGRADVQRRLPSAAGTIRKPMGWAHRFWRDITFMSNYTFQTTISRFTTFLNLLTSLLFVISSAIVVTGVGLNSDPIASSTDQDSSKSHPEPTTSCGVILNLCIFFYGLTKVCYTHLSPIDANQVLRRFVSSSCSSNGCT